MYEWLLSVCKWLLSVCEWLLREMYLTVTFAKKFTKKNNFFGNQSGPSDAPPVLAFGDVCHFERDLPQILFNPNPCLAPYPYVACLTAHTLFLIPFFSSSLLPILQ